MGTNNSSDESITPQKLVEAIKPQWFTVVVAVCLAGISAAAVAYLMTPIYRASVLLMPAQLTGQTGPLNSVLSLDTCQ